MDERQTTDAPTIDSDGGKPEQTWGQGEGAHQPTIEPETSEGSETSELEPRTYSEGTASELDEPDAPLAREDEGMDR
ncbi:MAG: hypothetical protein ACRDE6_06880 [Candidatus Limnocylindria bacterium]